MKKIFAFFIAMAFALSLGVAYSAENETAPATTGKAPAAEKSPSKAKKEKKAKKAKKAKKTANSTATPSTAAPAAK